MCSLAVDGQSKQLEELLCKANAGIHETSDQISRPAALCLARQKLLLLTTSWAVGFNWATTNCKNARSRRPNTLSAHSVMQLCCGWNDTWLWVRLSCNICILSVTADRHVLCLALVRSSASSMPVPAVQICAMVIHRKQCNEEDGMPLA